MEQSILVWDSERQVFSEIQPGEFLRILLPENSRDCVLFLAWMPHIKSVFLQKRKKMEIVFKDSTTYKITNMPYLYDKIFSLRHGVNDTGLHGGVNSSSGSKKKTE